MLYEVITRGAAVAVGEAAPQVHVAGRRWRLVDDRWIESTLDAEAASRRVEASSEEGVGALRELPGLERLLEGGRDVVLERDGEAIRLVGR